MIIEIALGIVLAVVILSCLPLLAALAAWTVLLAVAVGLIIGALALIYFYLPGILAVAIALGILIAMSAITVQVERRTKVSGAELWLLCVFVSLSALSATLLFGAVTAVPRDADAIGPLAIGLTVGAVAVACIGIRIARRYRTRPNTSSSAAQ